MFGKNLIGKLEKSVADNKKVIENYFFMTVLQVLNSFFYLLIYPFLIKHLGAEQYGLYVFINSIITYFVFFINFGFDFPATKEVAISIKDKSRMNAILSQIFTSKLILLALSLVVVILLVLTVPFFINNKILIFLSFVQIVNYVLFPQWFFQAIQEMKIVTIIQLSSKLLTLPFIFFFVRSPDDLANYILIVSSGFVFGSFLAVYILIFVKKMKISLVTLIETKVWFKESLPFFLSNSAGVIKEQSVALIIGTFFNMRDVAIYDLANKIVIIPRTLLMSINGAIFPKLIANINSIKIKKIIKIEILLSIVVIFLIIIFGKFAVTLLGTKELLQAYPLSIILSISIISWLVIGAFISFVFIPRKVTYYVTKNQLVALTTFGISVGVGLLLWQSIYVLGIAIAISTMSELLYCTFIINKKKLL